MKSVQNCVTHALMTMADASELATPKSKQARQLAEAVRALEAIEAPVKK